MKLIDEISIQYVCQHSKINSTLHVFTFSIADKKVFKILQILYFESINQHLTNSF